jgi:hypothetical protein
MNLSEIAELAEVAEDLAVKALGGAGLPAGGVRKVAGALWDAVTTLNHMLKAVTEDTREEGAILLARLEQALKSLGGPRQKLDQNDVDDLFRTRK